MPTFLSLSPACFFYLIRIVSRTKVFDFIAWFDIFQSNFLDLMRKRENICPRMRKTLCFLHWERERALRVEKKRASEFHWNFFLIVLMFLRSIFHFNFVHNFIRWISQIYPIWATREKSRNIPSVPFPLFRKKRNHSQNIFCSLLKWNWF